MSTSIPNVFIDKYMPSAPPTYSVIYIYAFRKYICENEIISNAEIADTFNVLESDVIKAWKFWEDKGIVSIAENGTVNFLSISEVYEKTKKNPLLSTHSPEYLPKELTTYAQKNEDIKNLFKYIEKKLGTTLSSDKLGKIFGLYEHFGLPIDVLEILISYCCEKKVPKARYIEAVGIDWLENGIVTKEKALDYINENIYTLIMHKSGQGTRPLNEREKYLINKWHSNYNFSTEIILEACDRSINSIGNLNLNYVNGIIEKWYKKDVHTIEDIKKLDAEHENTKKEKHTYVKDYKFKPKPNRFANFEERQLDFKKIKELEEKYWNKLLEED